MKLVKTRTVGKRQWTLVFNTFEFKFDLGSCLSCSISYWQNCENLHIFNELLLLCKNKANNTNVVLRIDPPYV